MNNDDEARPSSSMCVWSGEQRGFVETSLVDQHAVVSMASVNAIVFAEDGRCVCVQAHTCCAWTYVHMAGTGRGLLLVVNEPAGSRGGAAGK